MSAKTSISARIDRMFDSSNSKVKAVASVTIGGAFAVHGIKVIDSQKGLPTKRADKSIIRISFIPSQQMPVRN